MIGSFLNTGGESSVKCRQMRWFDLGIIYGRSNMGWMACSCAVLFSFLITLIPGILMGQIMLGQDCHPWVPSHMSLPQPDTEGQPWWPPASQCWMPVTNGCQDCWFSTMPYPLNAKAGGFKAAIPLPLKPMNPVLGLTWYATSLLDVYGLCV